MAQRGRPTKFNTEIANKIITAVRGGNYIETAAAFAGISKDTLYSWLRKGARQKKGPLRTFSDAIGTAMAEAEMADVAVVQRGALGIKDGKGNFIVDPDWKAAAWRLERRNQENWGKRSVLTIEDQMKQKSTEELERIANGDI